MQRLGPDSIAEVEYLWIALQPIWRGNGRRSSPSSAQRPSNAGRDNVLIIIRKLEAVRLELDPQIEVISTHLVDV